MFNWTINRLSSEIRNSSPINHYNIIQLELQMGKFTPQINLNNAIRNISELKYLSSSYFASTLELHFNIVSLTELGNINSH